MEKLDRRKFIRTIAAGMAMGVTHLSAGQNSDAPVVRVRNGSPSQLVQKAMEMLGGIEAFVKSGQSVLIKPNIGWDRLPEQAATTNPEVVGAVIRLCKEAGAKRIRVVDRTCNNARRCYRRSGIEEFARENDAQVRFISRSQFHPVPIPNPLNIHQWPVYKALREFDILINIPIAKVHNLCKATLGMKNLMGLLGGDRGQLHTGFAEKIVDINTIIRPTLTIIDAYRVLMRNGPSGGSLDDVAMPRTLFASQDVVAADAAAAELLGFKADDLEFLRLAQKRGVGSYHNLKQRLKQFDFSA